MGCQWQHAIQVYAKTQSCSLENLSKSTSFSFWTRLVFSTATPFFPAQVTLCFLMLVVNPAKPLSPGACTLWNTFGPCNDVIYSLSRIIVLQNLHQQVSPFYKLTTPPSHTSIETPLWKFWPPQEVPRCMWHFVKHPMGMICFGMTSDITL